ncbi:MAG: PAS domain-containing protein [Candidatus Harrisonbacteria bacterium]|nr:PAS domain-containing protein [Candidatus Harrisonbacteria bacterium]
MLNIILIILFLAAAGLASFLFFKINQQARVLRGVRLEKSRLDNIISSMSDAVIIYDQDFKILLFSGTAERIFNLTPAEAVGQKLSPESVRDLRLGTVAKVFFPSLAPVVVRQSAPGVEPNVVDISFDDPHLEVRVTTHHILDEKGEMTGFLKVIHDRTRSVDLVRSKSEFITIAAHQLRTPLSAINWVFQSLLGEPLTDSQKELSQTGLAAASNLVKIVEDLLNIAKVEEGRHGYNFQQNDLIKFLQSTLDQALPAAKEYKVNLFMEPPKEPSILIEFDPEKLGLAVVNLLENGIKYNVENGQVVISLERRTDAPFIQVNIADTGLGIPEDALDKLFTKFFRADNAVTKETAGSGLGLYIVKNVITRHGGQIWVDSVLSRGTTFHFTLPTDDRLIPQKQIAGGQE